MNLKELFVQRKYRLIISFRLGLAAFIYGFININLTCIDASACDVYRQKILFGLTFFIVMFLVSYFVQFIIKKIIEK